MHTLILDSKTTPKAHAGLYSAEIRDEFGYVESAATCLTVADVAKFYEEHKIRFYANEAIIFKKHESGNLLASYSYRPAPTGRE